jgi:hypothetical protein
MLNDKAQGRSNQSSSSKSSPGSAFAGIEIMPKPSKKQTPEQQELGVKQAELAKLQQELAQRELDLATLEVEMRAFEIRYLRTVGPRYAALDEIEAKIAEHKAALNPNNIPAQNSANAARKQADESAQRAQAANSISKKAEFKPSEELKKLYRAIAKQIHPDLSENEKERLQRERLMSDANIAFENGDAEQLRQILHEWESSPESVKGDSTAAELIRVIRKIAQARERVDAIDARISTLNKSELFQLKRRVEESAMGGIDLLERMAQDIDKRITAAQIELSAVVTLSSQ